MSIERRMALIGHLHAEYAAVDHNHDADYAALAHTHDAYAGIAEAETITGAWNFTTAPTISSNAIWHAGNDGASSGLDADTLDGAQATAFAEIAGAETITGAWAFTTAPTISASASHLTLYETDSAAPTDRGLVEVNGGELNLYGHDASEGTWRRFLGGNITTGGLVLGGSTAYTIGFYGSAGAAKPTVTGSRGGNAALASLLTALANLGLLVNSSSA